MKDPLEVSLEVAIDQLLYARQREWSGFFSIDRLKLRDLIVATVRPFLDAAKEGEHDDE